MSPTVSPQPIHPTPSSIRWSYSFRLPHSPQSVRVARLALGAALDGHDMAELVDTAQLLTSEMVTNSYRYTDGPSQVCVTGLTEHRLRVSVWDNSPVIPTPFDEVPGPCSYRSAVTETREMAEAPGGRGLLLVRLCADRWGGQRLGEQRFGLAGKLLWYELTAQPKAYGVAA
ncbi:ATP-binding protein [Streptomyces chattanoogensis]|uniref:ATP-binding protein n=1 Tax=Streptomyces chattanoogensis TaxID=66876 RepID=UPI0036990A13